MKKLLPLLLCFFALPALAQKAAYQYQGRIQAGLLEGEGGSAFQLQTIHGVEKKTWFAGLGGGLDYYHTRSLPVFLQVRKALLTREKTPFVYAGGGYHFLWIPEEKQYRGSGSKGGLYMDAGVGYQMPVMKSSALYFTAGYTQKAFSKTSTDFIWIAIWPEPQPQVRTSEYQLRRLSVQVGIRF